MAFVDDRHINYKSAEGLSPSAASAIAQAFNVVKDTVLGVASDKRDADFQRRQASRGFNFERDRLQRESELQERYSRQGFALGAVQELRKSNQKRMIQNIAIGVAIFGVLAIGIYYAGKK